VRPGGTCLHCSCVSVAPRLRFLVLGPLEVRVDGISVSLGGAKQRVVLAVLLLHADEVVSIERLIDDVWGEDPPASAAHTIEGYVSRLRPLLEPHETTIARRGAGYRLELRGAFLDLLEATRLLSEAGAAADEGQHRRASDLAREALRLWRGEVLSDAPLLGAGAAEVAGLEEQRVRALEQRIDADLALGRHKDLVGELRPLVDEHRYRERFVAQLMVALYRSGRQTEALELYERTRTELDRQLGLQPSPELQRLSAEIVRQDPRLASPAPTSAAAPPASVPRASRAGLGAFAFAGAVAAAGLVAFAVNGARDDHQVTASDVRVALVVPRLDQPGRANPLVDAVTGGLRLAEREYEIEATTLVLRENDPSADDVERVATRLRTDDYDLIIFSTFAEASSVAPTLRGLPETHVVLLDASVGWTDVFGELPRATGLRFDDERGAYLVGYLSGLMEARTGARQNRQRIVSAIGGVEGVPAVDSLMRGFERGAQRALPGVTVLTAYSEDFSDRSKCEALANEHIDAGADIVFSAAGGCSLGALSAAGIRGVWGVGVDVDQSHLGPHILASAVKRFGQAISIAVRSYLNGTLPAGRDVVLGLDDDGIGIAGISPDVPEGVRRQVAHAAAALQRGVEP
jgi:basic membrane lipoprotein Med (substrate-binding protein (PBP1-ABC) superfamily)/DNA-binding SARP family transcriptional activator